MKTSNFFYLLAIGLFLLVKCKPEELLKITKLQTGSMSEITASTAKASGTFVDVSVNVTEYGHCWNTTGSPGIADDNYKLTGSAQKGEYSSYLSGLKGSTSYHVKAFAQDGTEIIYGNEIVFSTVELSISITTPNTGDNWLSGSSQNIAWSDNFEDNVKIELFKNGIKPVENGDIVTNTPSDGSYSWILPANLANGNDYTLKITSLEDPLLTDESNLFSISQPSVSIGSPQSAYNWPMGSSQNISWTDNFPENVKIELFKGGVNENTNGPISTSTESDGHLNWSVPTNLAIGSDYTIKISNINDLNINAISPVFTISGERGTMTDLNGNNYATVKIGNQWWMAENLRVTHFPDGIVIQEIGDNTSWANLDDQFGTAFCYINNNPNSGYGALYTWPAAMYGANSSNTNPSGIQGVCPTGWHIPSYTEWDQLIEFLGGTNVAGGKLKETGFTYWNSPNTGASNETGFTAIGSGFRNDQNGNFDAIGQMAAYWTSSMAGYFIYSFNGSVGSDYVIIWNGYAVRCVKN